MSQTRADPTGLLGLIDGVVASIEIMRGSMKFANVEMFMCAAPKARDAIREVERRLDELLHMQLEQELCRCLREQINLALDILHGLPIEPDIDISDMKDALQKCLNRLQ